MGDIAFAAGFTSIRQFNATMLEVYDIAPRVLRERAAARDRAGRPGDGRCGGGAAMRRQRPARPACCGCGCRSGRRSTWAGCSGSSPRAPFPGSRWPPPTEYARTISLPNGSGVLSLRLVPGASWVDCSLALSDLRDVTAAVQRCRRLLDLDADPAAISGFFARRPGDRAAGGRLPRAARGGRGRRERDRDPGRARPAGVGRRRAAARRTACRAVRDAVPRPPDVLAGWMAGWLDGSRADRTRRRGADARLPRRRVDRRRSTPAALPMPLVEGAGGGHAGRGAGVRRRSASTRERTVTR